MSYVFKIAVVISAYIIFAAKSIARFNELKDRKMAEYYLIGTLLSIAFAMIAGIVTRSVIGGGI